MRQLSDALTSHAALKPVLTDAFAPENNLNLVVRNMYVLKSHAALKLVLTNVPVPGTSLIPAAQRNQPSDALTNLAALKIDALTDAPAPVLNLNLAVRHSYVLRKLAVLKLPAQTNVFALGPNVPTAAQRKMLQMSHANAQERAAALVVDASSTIFAARRAAQALMEAPARLPLPREEILWSTLVQLLSLQPLAQPDSS